MGISRKCVKTWLDRYAAEGEPGLRDRSSRPHSSPRRTAVSSNAGLCTRASKTTAVRYERDRPGELVRMDVKKIGRIPDGGGWRAHGRARREATRDRSVRAGFDYVHSLVDDRWSLREVCPRHRIRQRTRRPPTHPPTDCHQPDGQIRPGLCLVVVCGGRPNGVTCLNGDAQTTSKLTPGHPLRQPGCLPPNRPHRHRDHPPAPMTYRTAPSRPVAACGLRRWPARPPAAARPGRGIPR
ncbi:leucine-zipper of insertion element IS481 [Amycolatopsis saalfeldensis]|uniref:Leucine-zipper of insertion element IS481 n=1 Tax=Amycolatopsis saalfeldensis TaxID=394193 RepID=A0A1H8XDT0_9PSEU|nr:leucine-zipper of insertion element IS481 [Amycolatopsis saalfeldensis]